MNLQDHIRTIPDYPKPGILFRDITTLLGDADAFRFAVEALVRPLTGAGVSKVAGIEARGFILGGAVAERLGAGFVPLRKRGKLPHRTLMASYSLEYGVDELHMHEDALAPGERVLLLDDLIATGGTACAGLELLGRVKAHVVAASFVIDLPDLGGATRLREAGVEVRSLLEFPGH
jgi:adenine phosphoribosyltransferase